MSDSMVNKSPKELGALLPLGQDLIDSSPWRQRFNAIYSILRERITLMQYPPGARLDIDALTAELNVSRTPIRSVLQRLENEGLAVTRHGVGTTVTEINVDHIRKTMQLRTNLAELIGVLSPIQPSDDLILELEQLQRDCSEVSKNPTKEKFAAIDISLHNCKCRLIGNEVLLRIYDELYYRTTRLWFYMLPSMDQAHEFRIVYDDVNMTLDALRRGDVTAVGFITRNFNSAALCRIDKILFESNISTSDTPI
ncbi:GntR family transcriptional regulator [Pseudomonas serbica]|jgi:DNA-binding GntR family transcriptional regulator